MEELTILLVEDDPETCKNFARYADELNDLLIVSITNNASKALTDIQDFLPDAVILDLELHLGSGNGLEVLDGLNHLRIDIKPYVLITTNNSSNTTFEYARQLGADFIMSKHQNDYSEKNVLNFLRMMKSVIKSRSSALPSSLLTAEAPELYKKRITRRIMSELDFVGINPKAVGYQYLIDAIHIIIKKPTQNLCTIISQKHSKTESSVERAMQNAINRAWKKTDIDELYQHYTAKIHSSKGAPTITEFVHYYANKIKNDY
jgi:two-component system, response regulator, stage 0 sporulation protein A